MRLLGVLIVLLVTAPAALGAFPQTPPNDPQYAPAEHDCAAASVNDEEHYLYSTPSACTPAASVPGGAAGMSVDKAWREHTAGRPDVTIAYVEAGINWHIDQTRDLVNQVYLNAGELPPPTTPVDDGRLNVKDYADTKDANHNGYVDPEDLIVRFSDGKDDDHNGYVDDISGWDFYDHQNDPATTDDQYVHSGNQMRKAAAEADNGLLGAGVCPRCTILPIKAGAEALDRSDDLAQAWLYAGDAGASVIVSVTADIGYSTFMQQAIDHLWRKGVVMVEGSNDFDSTDHQGGMFHAHVIPGNGMLTDSVGVSGPAANAATTSFTARSGKTSWGTHNFLTVSTQEGSTSQSTPIHGGVYALLVSAGRDAGLHLSAAEVLQVARATATDIDDPKTNWPSHPGWDLQYGYGRPNLAAATDAIAKGDIPPVGWISSPSWYALFDPTRTPRVKVRGHVEARRSSSYTYTLQLAPGAEPADGDFTTIGHGSGTHPFSGRLGTADLSKLPKDFATRAYALSQTKTLETTERYTVTLRLRVTDAQGRVGEDRRTIAVRHDPTWLPHFPMRIGPGGEAQPQLVDLQGRGHLAAVFGDSDGVLHAIDMVSGRELGGWPRHTKRIRVTRRHRGVHPGHEPVVADAAVTDLDGHGHLSAIFTSTTGRVYVLNAHGRRRWVRTMRTGVVVPAIPRQRVPYGRLPHQGAFAPPVIANLNGHPDVVQSGWDGHIHAWTARGRNVKGWPVEVTVPAPGSGYSRLDDRKLESPPVVAQLDDDKAPELVVRSQQSDARGPDIQPLGQNYVNAYESDGKPVPGWPVTLPELISYYGSALDFITEGANDPAAADVDHNGRDQVAVSPQFSPTTLLNPDGSQATTYGPIPDATLGLLANPAKLLDGGLPADTQVLLTGGGAFGKIGGTLDYAEPGSGAVSIIGALLTTGSGQPIKNSMRLFGASSAEPVTGYPAQSQGLDFVGGAAIADVTGDGDAEVLEAGDSSTLHAFGSGGAQVDGFPKFTGGWTLFGPTVGDVDGDGKADVVLATREGYLMAWRTPGQASANDQWWSFRHDERNTSNYGTDARPPSRIRHARLHGRRLTFIAPGDDWRVGRVRRYRAGRRSYPAHVSAGHRETIVLPRRVRHVRVQAIDDAGNRGAPARVRSSA